MSGPLKRRNVTKPQILREYSAFVLTLLGHGHTPATNNHHLHLIFRNVSILIDNKDGKLNSCWWSLCDRALKIVEIMFGNFNKYHFDTTLR